jgi:hypothetical protein
MTNQRVLGFRLLFREIHRWPPVGTFVNLTHSQADAISAFDNSDRTINCGEPPSSRKLNKWLVLGCLHERVNVSIVGETR